ncbi:hypothetical protein ACIP4U_18605 [Streptomyces caelestis]|uniref:Lipoprotein n=1 Tax=Streptomyces caelestis TaxID=36816 RepID=A0A7W9LUK0_9ACTN|nr:hypothetical protein [Streptomyces caelestis]MBB5796766.1 hypothetical protein [Streptomyces caelestis]GGW33455.1 hypothetical protein GCM10010320_10590 [Streptomyces caelestis]
MLTAHRRVAAACLLTAVTFSVAGCSSGSDDGSISDKIAGADAGESGSSAPSASASADKDAPTFDFPTDVKVSVEREPTGDPAKDAILRDVAYSAEARLEGFVKGDGRAANLNRYFTGPALTYWNKRITAVKQQGLTSTGSYRYYDFEVTDIANEKTAAVRYCEDQRKAYSKEIKTGKVRRTQPSNDDFVETTLQAAKNSRGDWQVQQTSWKKAAASCVQR